MIPVVLVSTEIGSGRRVCAALRGHGCSVTCFDGTRPFASSVALARPRAVVLDTRFPDEPLPADTHELRSRVPEVKILLLAGRLDGATIAAAAARGVDAAVSRRIDASSLGTVLRELALGNIQAVAPPGVGNDQETMHGLSPRELQILRMVAGGASNALIARNLWIADGTVKYHLSNIFRKLGVANRTEASHYAHFHRLLEHGAHPAGLKEEEAA